MNMSLTLFVHYWHRWMLCEAVHPKFDFDVRSAIKVFLFSPIFGGSVSAVGVSFLLSLGTRCSCDLNS